MEETAEPMRLNSESQMLIQVIDDRTIEACQGGDVEAFRLLYECYKDRVYSIALAFFDGDAAVAKDATQHVFLKLMTRISTFRRKSEFSTWLYRIVANVCIDHKRAGRRLSFFGLLNPDVPDRRQTVEDRYIGRELEREVRAAIAGLKPKLRMAVLLKYFDDLSYDELAAALGCSKGTVASRLNRGHRILAKKLAHLRGSLGSGD